MRTFGAASWVCVGVVDSARVPCESSITIIAFIKRYFLSCFATETAKVTTASLKLVSQKRGLFEIRFFLQVSPRNNCAKTARTNLSLERNGARKQSLRLSPCVINEPNKEPLGSIELRLAHCDESLVNKQDHEVRNNVLVH